MSVRRSTPCLLLRHDDHVNFRTAVGKDKNGAPEWAVLEVQDDMYRSVLSMQTTDPAQFRRVAAALVDAASQLELAREAARFAAADEAGFHVLKAVSE